MTDIEILNALMFCEHKDCATCARGGEENCEKQLLRDARTAIKMQIDSARSMKEEIERLQDENKSLLEATRHSFCENDLVSSVNRIASACFDIIHDDLDEEDYFRIVAEMVDISKMFRARHKVSITSFNNSPYIEAY